MLCLMQEVISCIHPGVNHGLILFCLFIFIYFANFLYKKLWKLPLASWLVYFVSYYFTLNIWLFTLVGHLVMVSWMILNGHKWISIFSIMTRAGLKCNSMIRYISLDRMNMDWTTFLWECLWISGYIDTLVMLSLRSSVIINLLSHQCIFSIDNSLLNEQFKKQQFQLIIYD